MENHYSYFNKQFILSPQAEVLRGLAESLYPSYLAAKLKKNSSGSPQSSSTYQSSDQFIETIAIPALDLGFVKSDQAFWFRVLSETIYAELVLAEQNVKHTIVFQGSARLGTQEIKPKIAGMNDFYNKARKIAYNITKWSLTKSHEKSKQPFMISSGGGPGIMEAANRGAHEAGGQSIGLNINLPFEQLSNKYISKELNFYYHYFFTRKVHFLMPAKAVVFFPGGFGTMDELFETLTLIQTNKIEPLKIILFGKKFWKKAINLPYLLDCATISPEDLDLFEYHDDVDECSKSLIESLEKIEI